MANITTDYTDINALFVAQLSYSIARALLRDKTDSPSLADMQQGIGIIVEFDNYFVKAELDEEGNPIFPQDSRQALIGNYYDRLQRESTAALEVLPSLEGAKLKEAAQAVYREREKRAYAIPRHPDDTPNIEIPSDKAFAAYAANRHIFHAKALMRILRAAGYRTFNRASEIQLNDVIDIASADIKLFDGVDCEDIDHGVAADDDWNVQNIINATRHGFVLDEVEYDMAVQLKEACINWLAWSTKVDPDHGELERALDTSRQQALDFVRQQEANNPIKGHKRRIGA